jgi:hypothetical protein
MDQDPEKRSDTTPTAQPPSERSVQPSVEPSPGADYKPDSCLTTLLFWSGFLGFAGALGGTAKEKLWFLTGCTAVLGLVEVYLLYFGPRRRWTVIVQVIAQALVWTFFIIAVRHNPS